MARAPQSKFTSKVRGRILDAIRLGATYEHAAQYGGVTYQTFNEWRKKGRAEIERMERARTEATQQPKEDLEEFVTFVQDLDVAEGEAVVLLLAKIEAAASDGQWAAAAWKLERRYPELYGRQVKDHNVKEDVVIRVVEE